MAVDTPSMFAQVIQDHLELKRRNAALEHEMPLERYLTDDPFENHPLFKTEEQARVQVSSRPKRGARIWAQASPAAAQVPMQREHVTSSPIAWRMSPVSTGSSPPSCASPSTNGSRRKLVTSSLAIVRAALNVATP